MTRIDEIRERAGQATAGKWEYDGAGCVGVYGKNDVLMYDICECDDIWTENAEANGEFIAHSREDIPYLLGEIDKLRKENEGIRANGMIQEHIITEGRNPLDADKIIKLIMENTQLRSELSDPLTVRLPCKLGDNIWRIDKGDIEQCGFFGIQIYSGIHDGDPLMYVGHPLMGTLTQIRLSEIGKTVFLSREEAEKEAGAK